MRMVSLCVAFTVALAAMPSAADDWPTAEIRLSGYITDFGSDIQVNNSDDLAGSDVDLEDELDLDNSLEELRVDLRWRVVWRRI